MARAAERRRGVMFDPYYDFMRRYRFNIAKPVRHQQTCPVCGRKLVNTYLRDSVWKCRRCWEATQHGWTGQRGHAAEL